MKKTDKIIPTSDDVNGIARFLIHYQYFVLSTLSNLNLLSMYSSIASRNYFLNCRLVMDEIDLKWVTNENNMLLLLKQFHEYFRSKTSRF